jgi:radical SAM superfamily enzyme YgiQ (UPF0313 family)
MRNYGFDCCEEIENGQHLSIALIDADLLDHGTRHPNLVLLKISGYCKHYGHDVRLIEDYEEIRPGSDNQRFFDIIVMSCVFNFTYDSMIEQYPYIHQMIDNGTIRIGGTGFRELSTQSFLETLNKNKKTEDTSPSPISMFKANLPHKVEHWMPDYHLYDQYIALKTGGDQKLMRRDWDDYLRYSIGFTTRGCFRQCGFCVNRNLDHVQRWSPLSEFHDESRPYIYLWDDNIMGAPNSVFRKVMEELIATKKPFQFRQGMDIRLMNDEKADLLNKVKYHGDFIFAFDHYRQDDPKEARNVRETIKGLKKWREYCHKSTKLYVIVAYDYQDERDIEGTFFRIKTLMEFGCLPYIMRFEKWKTAEPVFRNMYVQLARWCNQPNFFKKMSFRQFCVRNEEYHLGIQNEHDKGIYPTKLPKDAKRILKAEEKKDFCSCYRTMLEFEERFPKIAKKYFDLRFEDINPYKIDRR